MARRSKLTDRERAARGAIAAALWVYSLGWGVLLGTVGALAVLMSSYRSLDLGVIVFAALMAIMFGGGFGFVVGLIVGVTLALIATIAPPDSRVSIVTAAIPLVALTVSMSPLVLLVGGDTFGTPLIALDATFTMVGSAWIYRNYRRLEDRVADRRVH